MSEQILVLYPTEHFLVMFLGALTALSILELKFV